MPFMEPELCKGEFYLVETECGTELVPIDVCGTLDLDPPHGYDEGYKPATIRALRDYLEGSRIDEIVLESGWYGRYSAPGYMDCTSWSWAKSRKALVRELREMYGDAE